MTARPLAESGDGNLRVQMRRPLSSPPGGLSFLFLATMSFLKVWDPFRSPEAQVNEMSRISFIVLWLSSWTLHAVSLFHMLSYLCDCSPACTQAWIYIAIDLASFLTSIIIIKLQSRVSILYFNITPLS